MNDTDRHSRTLVRRQGQAQPKACLQCARGVLFKYFLFLKFDKLYKTNIEANETDHWICGADANLQLFIYYYDGIAIRLDKIVNLGNLTVTSITALGIDNVFITTTRGTCQRWNVRRGTCAATALVPSKIRGAAAMGRETLIAVFGELSEIVILNAVTLEQTATLLSRLYPDWVTCALSLPAEPLSLLGITAGGTLKVWRLSGGETVFWEEESKQIGECSHPIQIALDAGTRQLAVLTRKSVLLIDGGDFTTLGTFEHEEGADVFTGVYFMPGGGRLLLSSDKGVLSLFSIEHILRDAQPGQLHHINSLRVEPGALVRPVRDEIVVILPETFYRLNELQLTPIEQALIENDELDVLGGGRAQTYISATCLIVELNKARVAIFVVRNQVCSELTF